MSESLNELKDIVLEKNEHTGLAYGVFEETTALWQLEKRELIGLARELDYALRTATEEYDSKRYNELIASVFKHMEDVEY